MVTQKKREKENTQKAWDKNIGWQYYRIFFLKKTKTINELNLSIFCEAKPMFFNHSSRICNYTACTICFSLLK